MTRRTLGKRARLLIVTAAGVLALAGCGSDAVDSGGLTARDRKAAQSAMDTLQNSNISLQLVTITQWVQNVPAACRIRLVSRNPSTYKVYVFWVPWLAAEPYVWLNMKVTDDPRTSTFHLGTVRTGPAGWQAERGRSGPSIQGRSTPPCFLGTGRNRPGKPGASD